MIGVRSTLSDATWTIREGLDDHDRTTCRERLNLYLNLPHEYAHIAVAEAVGEDVQFDADEIAVVGPPITPETASGRLLTSLAPLVYVLPLAVLAVWSPLLAVVAFWAVGCPSGPDLQMAWTCWGILRRDWYESGRTCPECGDLLLKGTGGGVFSPIGVWCTGCGELYTGESVDDALSVWQSDSLAEYMEGRDT